MNKYYAESIELENKIKAKKQANAKKEYSSTGNSSSNNNYNSNNSQHIGKSVYISNGNRYYHAISNCKYLEGASVSKVTLTSSIDKFECNCWTNPIPYKPSSNSGNSYSAGSTSSGKIVYIARGNSYYHKSPSCKFLQGASTSAVDLNNVGGKNPCNCIKY